MHHVILTDNDNVRQFFACYYFYEKNIFVELLLFSYKNSVVFLNTEPNSWQTLVGTLNNNFRFKTHAFM